MTEILKTILAIGLILTLARVLEGIDRKRRSERYESETGIKQPYIYPRKDQPEPTPQLPQPPAAIEPDTRLINDPLLMDLSPTFYPKIVAFLTDLSIRTKQYNQETGNGWEWKVRSTRRTGSGDSLHHTGRAIDINLYEFGEPHVIKDEGFKPEHWQVLEILRSIAQKHDLEWGGLYSSWDPVHLEDQPYNSARESVWFSRQPPGTVRYL